MSESSDKQRDETVLNPPVTRRPRDLRSPAGPTSGPGPMDPTSDSSSPRSPARAVAEPAAPPSVPAAPLSPAGSTAVPPQPSPSRALTEEPAQPRLGVSSAAGLPEPMPSPVAAPHAYPPPQQPMSQPSPTWGPPAPASGPGQDVVPTASGDEIATLPPLEEQPRDQSPIDETTGEPKRPVLIWVAAGLPFVGTALVGVAIGLIMWNSIPDFPNASWVNQTMETEPGSWVRVAFSVINAAIAALVGGTAAFLGYNIFTGRDWTRIAGIVIAVISVASLMLTPLAAISIAPIAIGAALAWLPHSRRFFNAWTAHRRVERRLVPVPERVHYGPLPRYQ